MEDRTSRLCLAPDDYSEMGKVERSRPQRQKAPLAAYAAVPMFAASGRGARRHHNASTNEGASSMAKPTRITRDTDSGTQQSAVKITPATYSGPVTTTHTVA